MPDTDDKVPQQVTVDAARIILSLTFIIRRLTGRWPDTPPSKRRVLLTGRIIGPWWAGAVILRPTAPPSIGAPAPRGIDASAHLS